MIFGKSAGSSSVIYQAMFPQNKGMFQRGISLSGGITSPWGFVVDDHADGIFADFSGEIGCFGEYQHVMACMRNRTEQVEVVIRSSTLNHSNVVPNRDNVNDFIPKLPQGMLHPSPGMNNSHKVFHSIGFLMGSCSVDGAPLFFFFLPALNLSFLFS